MSETQSDRAIEALYEDAGIREELIDSEARILLQWGAKQIEALASKNLDDGQFDESFERLRHLLTLISRFIGQRAYLSPDGQQERMRSIVEAAGALGYTIPAELTATHIQQQAVEDNEAALRALTAMIETSQPHPPAPSPSYGEGEQSAHPGTNPNIGETNGKEVEPE